MQPKNRRLSTEEYVDTTSATAAATAKQEAIDTAAADATAKADAARWSSKASLPSTVSFDSPLPYGQISTASGSNQGLPLAVVGSATSEKVSAASILTYKTWGTDPRLFMRGFSIHGEPYPWKEFAGRPEVGAVASRVSALENAPTKPRPQSGMKVVPLAMTAPGTPLSSTTDMGAVRWVRRYAVMPKRVRIHVSNANVANALKGNQSLSLTHVRVGVGSESGAMTQQVIAQAGGSLHSNGSETVTPWVTVPELADDGHVAVTVGWYGGGGTATLQHNQGGGWVTNDNSIAGAETTEGWTWKQTTPLHCWIEAEVPSCTPVVVGQGDSITIGTSATDPVGDSWVAKYALIQGALPVILAQHGSTMANWTSGSPRWKLYGETKLAEIVDAVVTTLGQNDLAATGMDLPTLQGRHIAFMSVLKQMFPTQPIYLGAITPSNKNATLEQLRRDFNSWRSDPAQRERGVLDFATVVGGAADEDLLPEYSADGLHPNTAGQQAMADYVAAIPVTPYTLSPAKLKALAGG